MSRITNRDLKFNELVHIDNFPALIKFCIDNDMNCCGPIDDKHFMLDCADMFIADEGEAEYKRMLKLVDKYTYCHFNEAGVFVGLTRDDFMDYKGAALREFIDKK
jgi:hypothetical protein